MMKNKTLLLGGTVFMLLGLSLILTLKKENQSLYHASSYTKTIESSGDDDEEWLGAAEWQYNRQKNQITGLIDMDEVIAIQSRASQTLAAAFHVNNQNRMTSAVLWNEIGPDNIGGRTRTILIDRTNSQHLFAGGVGGGLWESNDGANNWHRVGGFFSVPGVNINVVTIGQAPYGDLYVGTGEGSFYAPYGMGAGGFIGGGIYKSTDGGISWGQLASTSPSQANSIGVAWTAVNKIVIDPNDANHVFAATNKSLRVSTDGGNSWAIPAGLSTTSVCSDVEITTSGRVVIVISGKPWLSTDNGGSFANVGTAALGFTNSAVGRCELAFAPTDDNYVYAVCSQASGVLQGLWVSIDGAQTWTQVSGAGNAQFDPLIQGTYDLGIAVDPANKNRAVIVGTQMWEWVMVTNNPPAGQWNRIALEEPHTPFNPFYVHADKHTVVFDPTQPGVFYIGSDGGVARTLNNGQTYQEMNTGYNVTQCYSIAFDHQSLSRNLAMAGTQDNSTQFVNGLGNTSMSSMFVSGGDGGQCDISMLNPHAMFTSLQWGNLFRSNNSGSSVNTFYPIGLTVGGPNDASFVTPIRLWESLNDQLSGDTIRLVNKTTTQTILITSGNTASFTGNLVTPITSTPSATYLLNTVRFVCNGDTLVSNGSGTVTGDGNGTVNPNGSFNIAFNTTPPANYQLKALFDVQYGIGTLFTVPSNVQGRSMSYTSSVLVNPGDTIKVQDGIQSRLAVGYSSTKGVYVIRRPLDFSTGPEWFKIGGTNSSPIAFNGTVTTMAWSSDGDHLFVGTESGSLYRFSHIGAIVDSANGTIDYGATANPNCVVTCNLIGNFVGRWITGVDVDPNDASAVIVSLGNYSNTNYVYYSSSADTATTVLNAGFVSKTGNLLTLGGAPIYSVTFDKYSAGRVLVGTEHGVFETSDITVSAPSWSAAMAGLDNVAVDALRQQRWDPWLVPNSGCFYIGTHGRGMWRDDSSWQQPNGINDPAPTTSVTISNKDMKVYPNPVVENSNVSFVLEKGGSITVQIYDLTGKRVYERNHDGLNSGTNTIEFETGEITKGTYLIVINQGVKRIGTGRFVKV
jgi:Secretion system C-terminal sorting domain